jgi:hypothetical protein
MNSTTAVTVWNDKSGQSNTMTGTGTWSGGTMVFNGSTNAFSNAAYAFPFGAYSMFAVYSNTTAPAATSYMNAVYGSNGYPMLGVYDVNKYVSARSVVANTGALTLPTQVGWATRIASASGDLGYGIATDTSGNVYVTGYYTAALTLYNTGGTSGATLPFTSFDVFIAKYSSAGAVVWAAQIASASVAVGQGIATDTSGNVFVTGYYDAALTLYNTGGTTGATLTNASATNDVFIAKYTSAGAVVWATRIASVSSGDVGQGIATDTSDNVFVTGYYYGALTLYNTGGTTGATLSSTAGGNNCFIAKYSSAGAVVWAARIASASGTVGYGIVTDTSGNVFVTGQYDAALTLYNTGGTTGATLTNAGGNDCFVAKYTSAGAVSWATRIASASGDAGNAIATDASGNVFVTGYYMSVVTLYNTGGTSGAALSFTGGQDCFVAKYSSAGAVVWATRIAGTTTSTDTGQGIATDASGNVFVTGQYGAAVTLYNTGGTTGATLPFTGGSDCFVAKYTSAGAVIWATRIASGSGDLGNAITTDTSGNVFVTGYYNAALTMYNTGGTSGATLPFTGGSDVFIAKYNSNGFIANLPTFASSNVLVSATYTPSTFSPFINGSNATTLAGTTLTTTGIYLGGPSNYFNGSISEVLVFGTTLTATQRQSVEGYLAKKWAISGFLGTHPFYTIPPFNRYFNPTDVPGCSLWLDGADNSSMNSTTSVTIWNDKSGLSNTMSGTATWSGSNMVFNGSTNAFSNTTYVFPISAYSMFGVYSNTTAPAASAYMNAVYGNGGFPMLGVYDVGKNVSARSVVANTGALGVTVSWATYFAGGSAGNAIATDTSGNVFVTGGGADCFIAKYSSAGAVLWSAQIASTGTDQGRGITTDTSGNVFVTGVYGTFGATLSLGNAGGGTGATLAATGGGDCFIAKYTSAGTVSWAAQLSGGQQLDSGYAIATDTSGNVFVTGFYSNVFTLYNTGGGTGATLPITGGGDCFIAKYSSAGAVVWAAQITGSLGSSDGGYGIATDTSGNVFVTGYYGAALTLYNTGGTTGATLAFAGGSDCFIAKYSSAGAVVWATRIAGTGGDLGYGIATDTSGNVFVTGTYGLAVTLYNTGGTTGATLANDTFTNCFIAKYTSAGAVSWATRITPGGNGQGIATDTSGNVFVIGQYVGIPTLYNTGGTTGATLPTSFAGSWDCFIAKYSSAGAVVWAAQIATTGNEFGYGIATDTSGNVFVTGYGGGALTLYNTDGTTGATLTNAATDCFVAKYSPTGYISVQVPASSNVLVSATYTPSTFSPFINGTATSSTLAGTTLATTGIFVGGPSNYFNGSISELLIYSSTLSAAQRQQVEGYLVQKWRLSTQTLSNHPYKLIPPATVVP